MVVVTIVMIKKSGSVKAVLTTELYEISKKKPLDAVFLDVRTKSEVDKGSIKGKIHKSLHDSDFKDYVSKLDKDKIYYVYCHSGGRSASAARIMGKLGFEKVYNVSGGIISWMSNSYPVEK